MLKIPKIQIWMQLRINTSQLKTNALVMYHLITRTIIYAIPYHFHDYNHGWMIIILKDCAIMIIDFCNIKLNNSHVSNE
jgi:hypothetical protein